ncbi:hypothetical protein M0802_010872 [Mischocyttarus mexicanus]|nr:hypothetical protein M0802_010872 [Mischocyttarus mexicanus]
MVVVRGVKRESVDGNDGVVVVMMELMVIVMVVTVVVVVGWLVGWLVMKKKFVGLKTSTPMDRVLNTNHYVRCTEEEVEETKQVKPTKKMEEEGEDDGRGGGGRGRGRDDEEEEEEKIEAQASSWRSAVF